MTYFFLGMLTFMLTDSISDWISAKADELRARAESMKLDNTERKKRLETEE